MKTTSIISSIIVGMAAYSGAANAAITVNSHTFSAVTNGAITTTGTADWGYVSSSNTGFLDSNLGGAGNSYNNTLYVDVSRDEGDILTTVSGSPTIGAVTLTEGTAGTNTVQAQSNVSNYTFDGSTAYGSYGGFGPTEQDVWQMTFNDLGVGEFDITLYLGHSNTNRAFDMDISGSGLTPLTTTTPAISGLGSTVAGIGAGGAAFTYDINFTTTSATDALTLTHGGTGGTFGGAIFAGYTVTATFAPIPEPSRALLLLLGLVPLAMRRRR